MEGASGPTRASRVREHLPTLDNPPFLLAEALELEPGDTVVDVGCGSGILSIIAAKLGAGRVLSASTPRPMS